MTKSRFDLLRCIGVVWRLRLTAGWCRSSISLSVVRLLSVRFFSWSEFVNAMTAYLNCLKSLNQTKLHVALKNATTIFPIRS